MMELLEDPLSLSESENEVMAATSGGAPTATAAATTPKSLSTLENHHIPPFYACYLLRSKKNGKFSRRTYVGSTCVAIPHLSRYWR